MTPQRVTTIVNDLKTYLVGVAKIPAEQYKIDLLSGVANGICNTEQSYQLSNPDVLVFEPLPEDTQLRFDLDYTLYLDVKEFTGDIAFLIGQLLFWQAKIQRGQKTSLHYDVYLDHEKSCNLAIEFVLTERFRGTSEKGFECLNG